MAYDYKRYFGEITTLHDLTTRSEDRTWQLAVPADAPGPHAIVLYLGCNVLRTAHLVQTVTAVFDRLGLDYIAVGGPTYCCGIVHHQQGDTDAAGRINDHTLSLFERYQPEEVVMWCPSCIYFFDEIRQTQFPFRVRHTTEFLVSQLPRVQFTKRTEATLALHAHSVGEARQREAEAAQTLLKAVPGLRYTEVDPEPRFGQSCTPAVQQQLGVSGWKNLVSAEIAKAKESGAGTLATLYHSCQREICGFEDESIKVEHYLTVFARALGIEFEDKFKKYRLWQDPQRILADASPCQIANDIDPQKAESLVTTMVGASKGAAAKDSPS